MRNKLICPLTAGFAFALVFCISSVAQQTFYGYVTIEGGNLYLDKHTSSSSAPEVHWEGYNGSWLIGIDVHNPPEEQDFVPAAKIMYCQPNTTNCNPTQTGIYTQYTVHDLIYIHHGGTTPLRLVLV